MTPAERAAVHALAGAFSRLSLAAELAVLDAGQLPALERVRKLSLLDFAAGMDALAAPPQTSSAVPPPEDHPAALSEAPAASTTHRDCSPDAGGGRAVPSARTTPRMVVQQGPARVVHPPRGRSARAELAAAEAFLADKPALPKARPVTAPERGARHG